MSKKLVATLASVCLVAALGVGATLAYYTSTTEEKVNTFTVGNVDIEVNEPGWDPEKGKDLIPGAEVTKKPIITNTGSTSGYMMLQVSGMAEMAKMGFSVKNGDAAGYNTADWTLVDIDGNKLQSDGTLVDGYYVYKGAVAKGDSTNPLFTSVVLGETAKEGTTTTIQVVGELVKDADGNVIYNEETGKPSVVYYVEGAELAGEPFATYEAAEAEILKDTTLAEKATFVFDLKVKGYAIQSEKVEYQDASGVYTWVDDLTGGTPKTADAE